MLSLLGCLLLANPARAAYFLVEEGTEKCFQQDLLMHQVLRVSYTMHDKEVLNVTHESQSECRVLIKNPDAEVIKDHALMSETHEGALAIAPKVEGAYAICVHCASKGGMFDFGEKKKMRWSLAFDTLGVGSNMKLPDISQDPKNAASLTHFKGTQASVELILERMSAIISENDYEKTFEAKFVHTSEAVNTDVAAFKFLQILLITGVAAFQIHTLAKFLQKNRFLDCCLPRFMGNPCV